MKEKTIKRGDIYYANLNPVVGSEQGDVRPVLVVQNDVGNIHSPTIVVTPITKNLRKNPLPTHVILLSSAACGLGTDSLVLVEQIRTIDRSRLSGYIGRIGKKEQQQIDVALAVCVGIEQRRSPKGELFDMCLCPRCENSFREAEYLLVKRGWQEHKEPCDFCKVGKGLNFGVFNMNGGELYEQ